MVIIVHDYDLVPTLCMSNLYEKLTLFVPLIKNLPEDKLIKIVETLINSDNCVSFFQKNLEIN
jgi:hypothetical protein